MNPDEPSSIDVTLDAVTNLVEQIRRAGYGVGLNEHIAARELVLALAARGELDDPRRLLTLLRPILCTTPLQQHEFQRHFDRWFPERNRSEAPDDDTGSAQRDDAVHEELADLTRKRNRAAILIVGGLLVALVTGVTIIFTGRTLTISVEPLDRIPAEGGQLFVRTNLELDRLRSQVIITYPGQDPTPITLVPAKPQPDVGWLYEAPLNPRGGHGDAAYYVSAAATGDNSESRRVPRDGTLPLTIDPPITDIDDETDRSAETVGGDIETSEQAEIFVASRGVAPTSRFVPFFLAFLAAIGAFSAGATFYIRRSGRRYLERRSDNGESMVRPLFVDGASAALFDASTLLPAIRALRRHDLVASGDIDVDETARSTAEHAGWLNVVHRARPVLPEYLALVNRSCVRDQRADMIDELINKLRREGMFVTRFEFDGDPRLCFPSDGHGPPVNLDELAGRYDTHRLWIFGDGDELRDPFNGRMPRWTNAFRHWASRTFFTFEPEDHWGSRECTIRASGFHVCPATEHGLLRSAERLGTTPDEYADLSPAQATGRATYMAPLPRAIEDNPRMWTEPDPPEEDVLDDCLFELRLHLPDGAFTWLAACAIYPELKWNLTVFLGRKLEEATGHALVTADTLASLLRLPWFRAGYMPDWLRTRLREELTSDERAGIHAAVQDLLGTAMIMNGRPIDPFSLEIAEEKRPGINALWKILSKRKEVPRGDPRRDRVFMSFMAGNLSVQLPGRTAAGERAAPSPDAGLRPRGWVAIIFSGLVAGIAGMLGSLLPVTVTGDVELVWFFIAVLWAVLAVGYAGASAASHRARERKPARRRIVVEIIAYALIYNMGMPVIVLIGVITAAIVGRRLRSQQKTGTLGPVMRLFCFLATILPDRLALRVYRELRDPAAAAGDKAGVGTRAGPLLRAVVQTALLLAVTQAVASRVPFLNQDLATYVLTVMVASLVYFAYRRAPGSSQGFAGAVLVAGAGAVACGVLFFVQLTPDLFNLVVTADPGTFTVLPGFAGLKISWLAFMSVQKLLLIPAIAIAAVIIVRPVYGIVARWKHIDVLTRTIGRIGAQDRARLLPIAKVTCVVGAIVLLTGFAESALNFVTTFDLPMIQEARGAEPAGSTDPTAPVIRTVAQSAAPPDVRQKGEDPVRRNDVTQKSGGAIPQPDIRQQNPEPDVEYDPSEQRQEQETIDVDPEPTAPEATPPVIRRYFQTILLYTYVPLACAVIYGRYRRRSRERTTPLAAILVGAGGTLLAGLFFALQMTPALFRVMRDNDPGFLTLIPTTDLYVTWVRYVLLHKLVLLPIAGAVGAVIGHVVDMILSSRNRLVTPLRFVTVLGVVAIVLTPPIAAIVARPVPVDGPAQATPEPTPTPSPDASGFTEAQAKAMLERLNRAAEAISRGRMSSAEAGRELSLSGPIKPDQPATFTVTPAWPIVIEVRDTEGNRGTQFTLSIREEHNGLWVGNESGGTTSRAGDAWIPYVSETSRVRIETTDPVRIIVRTPTVPEPAASETPVRTTELSDGARRALAASMGTTLDAFAETQEMMEALHVRLARLAGASNLRDGYDEVTRLSSDVEASADQVSEAVRRLTALAEKVAGVDSRTTSPGERAGSEIRDFIERTRRAESSMNAVHTGFRDTLLYLKHNLNTRAIESLRGTETERLAKLGDLRDEVEALRRDATRVLGAAPAGKR